MNNAPSSRYVIISVVIRDSPNQNQYLIERDGVVLNPSFNSLDEAASYIQADKDRRRVIGFRALPFIRVLSAILVLALVASAHADLGDTYAQSCQRYGGVGTSGKHVNDLSRVERAKYGERVTTWKTNNAYVAEVFKKDQVVSITYLPLSGSGYSFTDEEIWHLLKTNALPKHEWHEYRVSWATRAFVTDDDKLYGILTKQGCFVINYKSWMVANNLFVGEAPDRYELPPSQHDEGLEKTLNSK